MKLEPLYDKIIVELQNIQEIKSGSGLVLTKNMSISANTTMKGTVVACGEGRLLTNGSVLPLKVKVGDDVIITKLSGESYEEDGKEYTIISESSVLAICKTEENKSND